MMNLPPRSLESDENRVRLNGWSKIAFTFFLVLPALLSLGQIGGRNSFDFLQLVQPARIAAIGGSNVSIFDGDVNLAYTNPGLLNAGMHDKVALNFVDYFAGIKYGNASYTFALDTNVDQVLQVNLMHANYGDFQYADETGVLTGGNFTASDVALNVAYARQLSDDFRGGMSVKFIYSVIESYQAIGMAIDIGGIYVNKENEFSIGGAIRNIGPKAAYSSDGTLGARAALPAELVLGITKKLKYAPFRLSMTLENLQKWDLTLANPNLRPQTDPLTGDLIPIEQPGFLNKAMRHVVLGAEILLSDNFHIRTGFNYRRRQELILAAKPGLVGFSIGLGFKINRFHLSYARSSYHRAGGTNSLSISTKIGDFRSKG
ncbi:MAG: type IX secretion system protein PorQ [Flavobacteriales bacterium]|nr:type IX secretion system protein PorQ [Flavobacteriales bacterium]